MAQAACNSHTCPLVRACTSSGHEVCVSSHPVCRVDHPELTGELLPKDSLSTLVRLQWSGREAHRQVELRPRSSGSRMLGIAKSSTRPHLRARWIVSFDLDSRDTALLRDWTRSVYVECSRFTQLTSAPLAEFAPLSSWLDSVPVHQGRWVCSRE